MLARITSDEPLEIGFNLAASSAGESVLDAFMRWTDAAWLQAKLAKNSCWILLCVNFIINKYSDKWR